MNDDSPRYQIIAVRSEYVSQDLQAFLRPGDRVVSIYPVQAEPKSYPMFPSPTHVFSGGVELHVLIELRHSSWAQTNVGWTAGAKEQV